MVLPVAMEMLMLASQSHQSLLLWVDLLGVDDTTVRFRLFVVMKMSWDGGANLAVHKILNWH